MISVASKPAALAVATERAVALVAARMIVAAIEDFAGSIAAVASGPAVAQASPA